MVASTGTWMKVPRNQKHLSATSVDVNLALLVLISISRVVKRNGRPRRHKNHFTNANLYQNLLKKS